MAELTGNRRFRKSGLGFKEIILQVEVSEFITINENKPGRWVCSWRDATANDLIPINGGYYHDGRGL